MKPSLALALWLNLVIGGAAVGIVFAIEYESAEMIPRDRAPLLLTLTFGLLFAYIGVGLVRQWFQPRVSVFVSEAKPHMGNELTVAWRAGAGHRRLKSLRLWIEGREERVVEGGEYAEYWGTEVNVFASAEIASITAAGASPQCGTVRQGVVTVRVPAAASWGKLHGGEWKVVWAIRVEAEPGFKWEYPLEVRVASALCPICSHDLRATPDKCPQCGHVPAKVQSRE